MSTGQGSEHDDFPRPVDPAHHYGVGTQPMSVGLVAWLRACLDEDEHDPDPIGAQPWADLASVLTGPFDPAFIRADIAAKRAILDRYQRACIVPQSEASGILWRRIGYRQACLDVVQNIATVYADRPGYREEWRP